MPMLLYGNGTISGATTLVGNISVAGYANVSQGLSTVSRGINGASVPSGSILQVQQTLYTSTFTTTSGYVTVFGVNITPTSATSKILVSCSVLRCGDSWNSGRAYTSIWRNEATNLIWQMPNNWAGSQGDTNSNTYTVALEYLDSPATTSQITYNVRIAPGTGGVVAAVNRTVGSATAEASASVITAMEIAQ